MCEKFRVSICYSWHASPASQNGFESWKPFQGVRMVLSIFNSVFSSHYPIHSSDSDSRIRELRGGWS